MTDPHGEHAMKWSKAMATITSRHLVTDVIHEVEYTEASSSSLRLGMAGVLSHSFIWR